MERQGRISRGVEKVKRVIFKDQERAKKVAHVSYGISLSSLIGALEAVLYDAPHILNVGLFVLSFLSFEVGLSIDLRSGSLPSRNPIIPEERSFPYQRPHPPTS